MKQEKHIALHWLKEAPKAAAGVTWGVPWEEGALQRNEELTMISSYGEPIPVQSWPTAYWSDGSVKWTAHSAVVPEGASGPFQLMKGKPAAPKSSVTVKETETEIQVSTGGHLFRIGREGNSIIRSIVRDQQTICSDAQLICIREEQSETMGSKVSKEEKFRGKIDRASVEQAGPVRAVVLLEGRHQQTTGGRQWLPFKLRLYFYAGQSYFRIVHTFIYDGNPHQDFIKGLGMTFALPMQGPLYNRHVRMSGDTGSFRESPKNLMTYRTIGKYMELYQKQAAGERISFDADEDARFMGLLDRSPVWDSFKLVQDSADHYVVVKRTKETCSWLKAAEGNRAGGLIFVGSEAGGLAAGMKQFWEKHPSALEAEQLASEEARMNLWFWSPDAKAMDLRHYDTKTYVESSYEGFDEMRSTPYGIANTNEVTVWCLEQTPDEAAISSMTDESQFPAMLRCNPEYYHAVRAFGLWSLPDRSTPIKAWIEDQLDDAIQFYKDEIEQRRWYGFWDYGDVMHSYDPVRHAWRYDIGGCAWQNTELVPNMWLWYMYLRSGRDDIFRMAEAMTRHTSEVDVYHLGEYAGLGSRHNVIHWGCGCKEARISMAGLHRFYYYLTADERIGDIMDEVKDADFATLTLDPMRAYYPKDEYPTHARVGPDWAAFSSNWLTRWERYEDAHYRDKLKVGIESLKKMPHRMMPLATHGYDPHTGELFYMGKDSGGHLAICMGGPQVWIEMTQMLKDPEWEAMLVEIGAFYNLPREEKVKRTGGAVTGRGYGHPMFSAGIAAYAAMKTGDRDLARLAWDILLSEKGLGGQKLSEQIQLVDPSAYVRPVKEIPWISTNVVSQWSLNAIMCLELIGDHVPESLPE